MKQRKLSTLALEVVRLAESLAEGEREAEIAVCCASIVLFIRNRPEIRRRMEKILAHCRASGLSDRAIQDTLEDAQQYLMRSQDARQRHMDAWAESIKGKPHLRLVMPGEGHC